MVDCPDLAGVPGAQDILARVDERAQSDAVSHGEAARRIAAEDERDAAFRERAALFQAKAQSDAEARLRDRVERFVPIYGNQALYRAAENDLYGLSSPGTDKFSVEARAKGWNLSNDVTHILQREGLFRAAQDSANKPAARIAEILQSPQERMREAINARGAAVGKADNYATRTSHDPAKIQRAGFDAWNKAVTPLLDERTFEGIPDRPAFMRSVYDALTTGVHYVSGNEAPTISGQGSLAKRLSQERVFQWKDADAWMDYQKQFGTGGSLLSKVLRGVDHAAKSESLMDRYGPNPRAGFDKQVGFVLGKDFRDKYPDAVTYLKANQKALDNAFEMA